jgi:hypothetical protein
LLAGVAAEKRAQMYSFALIRRKPHRAGSTANKEISLGGRFDPFPFKPTFAGCRLRRSFVLFWKPFDGAMMVAADAEARTPLLIDASGKDDALQALYEVRLCASAWRIKLGSRAEFYCVTRISQQYRELKRSAQ